jgi:riboflavin synthase
MRLAVASPGARPEEARLFTGIVEDLGEVEAVEHLGDFARIHIRSSVVTQDARPGDSICVSGVCLTVTSLISSRPAAADDTREHLSAVPVGFTADVMGETLRHSSLKSVAPGTKVNLERSVRLEDRLGGHLVQGHTDGTATIVSRDPQEHWEVVRISLPVGLARYIVHKGSITVDGVSLTVSALSTGGTTPPNPPGTKGMSDTDWFEVSLIPETLKRTTLGLKQPGAEVNLEVDVVAKYVEKLLGGTR